MELVMRDIILLISISAATIVLTVAMSLNPLAAVPGVIGVLIGAAVLRFEGKTGDLPSDVGSVPRSALSGRADRSPAA
jgi:hypothetical protein